MGFSTSIIREIPALRASVPFRWQIIIGVLALMILTGMLAVILAVFDARARAAVETRANISAFRKQIAERAREVQNLPQLDQLARSLAVDMSFVRHVRFQITDLAGNTIGSGAHRSDPPTDNEAADRRTPDWFVALVHPLKERTELELTSANRHLGTITIVGEPGDEISESWEFIEKMTAVWLVTLCLLAVGLFFVLGRILDPLVAFAGGLNELGEGHYAFRIPIPKVKELAAIASSFNKLASALDEANAENSRLYRQLITVQESERRQLSGELHDEFGPCIFGLTAGLDTIARQAALATTPEARAVLSNTKELSAITAHLGALTRSIIGRLRPAAFGHTTLRTLLEELVSSFTRRHPDVQFDIWLDQLPDSLGELSDVAIYRSVQEGLTNALRHGKPRKIRVAVAKERPPEGARVRISIEDDGTGFLPPARHGYGLSGMSERAKSLGGALSITPGETSGSIVTVTVPCAAK